MRKGVYILFLVLVVVGWGFLVSDMSLSELYQAEWPVALTMIFGSFIAGSSPEGSAAVAYPIFTLFLKIDPAIVRNFAFAIQSIGMTAASLTILGLKLKLEWNYIKYVTAAGWLGLLFGTFWVVPYVSPIAAKLFFVSLWLGFAWVLYKQSRQISANKNTDLVPFGRSEILILLIFGFAGGILSSIFGTGINILTFCLMVAYYKIDEKVAVPSSVIIMTAETLAGVVLHLFWLDDFQPEAYRMWLASVPFVVVFAPLGAFVMSRMASQSVSRFISIILLIQFVGAIYVIRPTAEQWAVSILTLLGSILFFSQISKVKNRL